MISRNAGWPPPGKAKRAYPLMKQRYFPIIRSHILRNSGTREDAEDIFHDSILIFYRRTEREGFQLECSPGTFLYSIARNLWRKRLRRKILREKVIEQIQTQMMEEPLAKYEDLGPYQTRLRAAFRKLPCPCRRLLNYFYFHKKKYEEIAVIMGISTAQVAKNQKLRCMQRLRRSMGIAKAYPGNDKSGS